MSDAPRPLGVLLGALGGQGGGVPADWLDGAAEQAGYRVQATSIPGVAQRTGATTYYVEIYPQRDPPGEPVFNLYPSPGHVDLVATLEPTEAGRALKRGFVTETTTVISTLLRLYSTAEKVIAGDGTADLPAIVRGLHAAARRLVLVDGRDAGQSLNALMLGAIAGSGVLPLPTDAYREAIRGRGVAVDANLAGFEAGLAVGDGIPTPGGDGLEYDPAPDGFAAALETFPAAQRPLLGHALARLVDYQGKRYARRYLERLQPIVESDDAARGHRLTGEVARRLAAWMSFEDVIRVAQLKTRPGRLARVRREIGADPGDHVVLRDYLKPGSAELRAILPRFLAGRPAQAAPRRREGTPGFSMRLPTSSPVGYALLKTLATLRPIRPLSSGYHHEQAAIRRWLAAVRATAAAGHYDTACKLAEAALLARGYGDVRRRGMATLAETLDGWEERLATDPERSADALERVLHAAREEPDD